MAAVAINDFAYNFIKIHRTLRVSPALAARVTTRLFDVMDLVNLLIDSQSEKPPLAAQRDRYRAQASALSPRRPGASGRRP